MPRQEQVSPVDVIDVDDSICRFAKILSYTGVQLEGTLNADQDFTLVQAFTHVDILPRQQFFSHLIGKITGKYLDIQPVHKRFETPSLVEGGHFVLNSEVTSSSAEAIRDAFQEHIRVNCPSCPLDGKCPDKEVIVRKIDELTESIPGRPLYNDPAA